MLCLFVRWNTNTHLQHQIVLQDREAAEERERILKEDEEYVKNLPNARARAAELEKLDAEDSCLVR